MLYISRDRNINWYFSFNPDDFLSSFYASAFRRRRHYVFGLSVRPSVRPKPEIPYFDQYMGPLVHPTNRNRFTACPSVRPSGEVSGHLPENACRDWLEILQADVSWPSSKLISLLLTFVDFSNFGAILRLVKRVKLGVSGLFPENAWREWPEILHADVSWPPSELISLWPKSVGFSNFGAILLSETGQIWGFRALTGERMKEMAWNFARWCIVITSRTDTFMAFVCWFC